MQGKGLCLQAVETADGRFHTFSRRDERGIAPPGDQAADSFAFLLFERRENVPCQLLLVLRHRFAADPASQPGERVRSELFDDRIEAVVTSVAPFQAQPERPEGKMEVVDNNKNIVQGKPVRFNDRLYLFPRIS